MIVEWTLYLLINILEGCNDIPTYTIHEQVQDNNRNTRGCLPSRNSLWVRITLYVKCSSIRRARWRFRELYTRWEKCARKRRKIRDHLSSWRKLREILAPNRQQFVAPFQLPEEIMAHFKSNRFLRRYEDCTEYVKMCATFEEDYNQISNHTITWIVFT